MPINPHLAQVLEIYEPERLSAILLWLNSELKDMFPPNNTVDVSCLEANPSGDLALDELVQFSILDEFGLDFSQKPAFPWLRAQVCQRVSLN